MIEQKVRESFARQSMMSSLGAKMGMLSSGEATLSAEILAGFKQQQGFAHGGLVFALADSAAGYSALTLMPLNMEVMTAELKINYLAAGQGTLVAKGRVLKAGKRLIVVAADVWAEHNSMKTHIAAVQGTMVPVFA